MSRGVGSERMDQQDWFPGRFEAALKPRVARISHGFLPIRSQLQDSYVVAGFSPRPPSEHCVHKPGRTRAEARDYTDDPEYWPNPCEIRVRHYSSCLKLNV